MNDNKKNEFLHLIFNSALRMRKLKDDVVDVVNGSYDRKIQKDLINIQKDIDKIYAFIVPIIESLEGKNEQSANNTMGEEISK